MPRLTPDPAALDQALSLALHLAARIPGSPPPRAEALLAGDRLTEVSQPKHAHPKYCLKMATGTGKTRALTSRLAHLIATRRAWPSAVADRSSR